MKNILSDLGRNDVIKLIGDLKASEEMINSQLHAAIDIYSQVKGEKTLAYAKKNLEDTNEEIVNSDGFLVLRELCTENSSLGGDEEFEDFLKKKKESYLTKKKLRKDWEKVIEKLDLPSTKMLLSQKSSLISINDNEILISIDPSWKSLIPSRIPLIEKAAEEAFGVRRRIIIEELVTHSNNESHDNLTELIIKGPPLSLLKPWKGILNEKKNIMQPSLPWESSSPIDIAGPFARLLKSKLVINRVTDSQDSEEKETSLDLLNFNQKFILKKIFKNRNNLDLISGFFQVKILELFEKNQEDIKEADLLITKKLKETIQQNLKSSRDILPKNLDHKDPLWSKLITTAEKLRDSIFKIRFDASEKIPSYFGDEKESLFEDVFQFLDKNNLNPIAIPTIEKMGKFNGGYYLVKRISNVFSGLKNIREPYSKWVVRRLDPESKDKENSTWEKMDSYRTDKNVQDVHWLHMYKELEYFAEKYIDNDKDKYISLPSYSRELAKWVSHQRMNMKRGRLQSEKIKRLENLKGWDWSHSKQKPY
ncbi:Helicase associated domain protein [Prochlorococcus marinus]|uniref:Helicase associated domain protein n=1 Tax=Prochlorococcus marinus TaxID=1219 RepID=UPI0022B5787D|nr:Helicase associated domain protein [Prochlorococcus marinus]